MTLANIFYVYRKSHGMEQARSAIKNLLRIGNVAALESAHIRQAIESGRPDFEDEIQIACAAEIPGLSAIVTRNLEDYQHATPGPQTAEAWNRQHTQSH